MKGSIKSKHGKLAFQFASAITNGNFSEAYRLLSEEQQNELNPERLEKAFEKMIEYGKGPVHHIELMKEMTEWPSKEAKDVGWAYVAMVGDGFSEAVSVVVSEENKKYKIREIEWGRP
ncbi:hypothetical protein LQ318_02810 [Aliifodinibius salicampi]|uniref:Uncharacterized protein n=1 Tax=Fodinibius salicampi TaxID=1920655 RepID=A0ABT3PVF8_9BACT|nr:hypothetical protein [Fodinibius salicampi]MCW9711825.1 hypothetical protein [Fodinibius salicampi]